MSHSFSPSAAGTAAPARDALHPLLRRLHFWGGLIGAPIVLFAAFTGLLYAFSPQVESWRHGALDHVSVGAQRLPLDRQVDAALAVAPGATLRQVVPAQAPDDSTQVYLRSPHEAHAGMAGHDHGLPGGSIVYVDPYTARVLGRLDEMARFKTWARKLHSSALQGDGWRWVMELGASWMLVLYGTGLVLWWPAPRSRGGRGWAALWPRLGRGRPSWRDLHASVALSLGLVLAVVLVTGLTWSRYSGERFSAAMQSLGQQTPRPARDLRSTPGDGPRLDWQDVWQRARAQAPAVAMQITPPAGDDGVWRVENFDRAQPQARFALALDARSGALLFSTGWAELPPGARATALGIPFHRGEYGLWNQLLLAGVALAAIFSGVSGVVMWWLRRPRGRLAAPPLTVAQLRQVPRWLWPVVALLGFAMPVFGASLLVLVGLEAARLVRPGPGTPAGTG